VENVNVSNTNWAIESCASPESRLHLQNNIELGELFSFASNSAGIMHAFSQIIGTQTYCSFWWTL